MKTHETPFTDDELQLLQAILSPAYVVPAARAWHARFLAEVAGGPWSEPDPVLGAHTAYRQQIRPMVLKVVRWARHREIAALRRGYSDQEWIQARAGATKAVRLGIRSALEALGYMGAAPLLEPVPGVWRRRAPRVWKEPKTIWATSMVPVHGASPARVLRSVLRASGALLERVEGANRAVLRGRVYRRDTADVMVHVQIAPDELRHLTLQPARMTDQEVARAYKRGAVGLRRLAEHPIAWLGDALLDEWIDQGFLTSPAGLAVSGGGRMGDPDGYPDPTPALAPANGVPMAISVSRIEHDHVRLRLDLDHRAFDGDPGVDMHRLLRWAVPWCCMHAEALPKDPADVMMWSQDGASNRH